VQKYRDSEHKIAKGGATALASPSELNHELMFSQTSRVPSHNFIQKSVSFGREHGFALSKKLHLVGWQVSGRCHPKANSRG
jgi:hypothetical protein